MLSTIHTIESDAPADTTAPAGLTLTILWHPDPLRIGRTAGIPFPDRGPIAVSRLAPLFDDGEPLADPRVSRSPIQLTQSARGLAVTPGRPGLKFSLYPAQPADRIPSQALQDGVCLSFGSQGPIVLLTAGVMAPDTPRHGLIGGSAAMRRVRAEIDRLAGRDFAVLVTGPTGTGKELVSAALHSAGPRARRDFVAVNVATLAPGTAGSQLFGHTRGSFTGATGASPGLFVQADGGTLLLDEIGACPMDIQATLLRVLETKEVLPLGGRPRAVNVRVVAATDENLDEAIEAGRFRSALYFRLAHGQITLPALKGRYDDIAAQALHHLVPALREEGLELTASATPWLTRAVMEALLRHDWPGNSRELRRVCELLAIHHADAPTCGLPKLKAFVPAPAAAEAAPTAADGELSLEALEAALRDNDYQIRKTAAVLGISRNRLRRQMALLNLPRAGDLSEQAIREALTAAPNLVDAARALRISLHALKLRKNELGL